MKNVYDEYVKKYGGVTKSTNASLVMYAHSTDKTYDTLALGALRALFLESGEELFPDAPHFLGVDEAEKWRVLQLVAWLEFRLGEVERLRKLCGALNKKVERLSQPSLF